METITNRAAKVLAEIDTALALAEKATPWPWGFSPFAENDGRVYDYLQGMSQGIGMINTWPMPNAAFIAASRTSLRCLKTAIEGLLCEGTRYYGAGVNTPHETLNTLCEQWEETK